MSNDVVEVYGSNNCPYCVKAVNLLEQMGLNFKKYDIFSGDTKSELAKRRGLESLKGQTIPQIFINNEFIGGFTELQSKY